MMYKMTIDERLLHFRQPAGTSRGVYTERRMWLVRVTDGRHEGVGECAPLTDLSCDDVPNYGEVLRAFCDRVERECTGDAGLGDDGPLMTDSLYDDLRDYPSMLFGLETALLTLRNASHDPSPASYRLPLLYDTPFSRGEMGIPINGLVWMGTLDEMQQRIDEKLAAGFHCVKLKIGALDFDSELELIKQIRRRYSHHDVELRVDANGAFCYEEGDALYKLELLSQYQLHSIEQPIRARQWALMAELCRESPLPIALDEELIGVNDPDQKAQMLNIIRPAYVVLKPSLHGGMQGTREWVALARERGIGSWVTSALESNVGLNAIAQLTADIYGPDIRMAQGLGTGLLFTDNIPMPLEIRGEKLFVV